MRRWRQRGPIRRPGAWTPASVVDDRELAEVIADLLQEEEGAGTEARVVSSYELLHELRAEDRERVLDQLNCRTTADIERNVMLRRRAEARLASYERRSGRDRRTGRDRRSSRRDASVAPGERRFGRDRRSGIDRRRTQPTA